MSPFVRDAVQILLEPEFPPVGASKILRCGVRETVHSAADTPLDFALYAGEPGIDRRKAVRGERFRDAGSLLASPVGDGCPHVSTSHGRTEVVHFGRFLGAGCA